MKTIVRKPWTRKKKKKKKKKKFYKIKSCKFTWMVSELGSKWPCSYCFAVCHFQDLFKTACSILVKFPSSFFSKHFVRVQVVQPYNSTDTATASKNHHFILSERISILSITCQLQSTLFLHVYWYSFQYKRYSY